MDNVKSVKKNEENAINVHAVVPMMYSVLCTIAKNHIFVNGYPLFIFFKKREGRRIIYLTTFYAIGKL